jgi:hypothetical protein
MRTSPEAPVNVQDNAARRRPALKSPVVWLSALLIVVLAGWGSVYVVQAAFTPQGCKRRIAVEVVAAPSIAQTVADIARADTDPRRCVDITVVARDSAQFADALVNPPPGEQPHAWLPESSFWLGRAQARGAFTVPDRGTSVATSPVVIGMTEPAALQLGWPAKPLTWAPLLDPTAANIPVGLPDPANDPTGVAALVGLQTLTAGLPQARAVQTALLRRLTRHTVARAADLYQRLPESGAADPLNAFFTSEQALLRHNSREKATGMVAAYPDKPIPTLDFPYVVLPGTDRAVVDAATTFLATLLAPAARRIIGLAGFRDPDGAAPAGDQNAAAGSGQEAGRTRTDAVASVPMPDQAELIPVLSAWTGVQLSSRILAVLDVSGSMSERTGNETRLSATVAAIQQGLGLMLDTSEVGLWLFATAMDGERDYMVLNPVVPLGPARAALIGKLAQVQVKPGGGTGLYDTTLAAYQDARRNWVPGRINVVMIATDGKNDDPKTISRANLIAELKKLNDPRRPLPIVFIGIGGGIDPAELTEIAAATDGKVFQSPDASGIRQIFFTALSDLGCQPPSCRK